ncbi:S-layer homology domain-containing protein [Alkaliphilus peptidifermentans]|uniref:S-layer homology domain-containing protein n=1 Tax=Alkaliphilus peptidifermentans TaxID=426129 RepID=UPI000AA2E030|nr:S-layer homology domain-containing protein [Alkaliphilus peptidifermentans]
MITNTPEDPSAINRFTDASAIAHWAKGYVGEVAAKGYMGGYPDGSFKPTNNITRAEAVMTLIKHK